jgi:hypothetical protein
LTPTEYAVVCFAPFSLSEAEEALSKTLFFPYAILMQATEPPLVPKSR